MNKRFKKIMAVRGMGAALTAFVGLIIIYVAFGLIQPQVFSMRNVLNLLHVSVYMQNVIVGVIIIGVVAFSMMMKDRREQKTSQFIGSEAGAQ